MYALCSDAMLKAITRQARSVDAKVAAHNAANRSSISIAYFFDHLATDEDTAVMVTEQDYIDAHKELVPSVSADELRHYDRVRRTFEGAGKTDAQGQPQIEAKPATNGSFHAPNSKGKGKAPPSTDADGPVENVHLPHDSATTGGSGSGSGSRSGSASSKGKGKAPAPTPAHSHASKSSVDIAAGGFGDAADDGELYD